MIKTTLCYIEKDNKYLMLHRTKKENDMNEGKWIGIGGKVEEGESVDECLVREVREETGLNLLKFTYRGIIYFRNPYYYDEDMYLYTSTHFTGEISECNEGDLKWIDKDKIYTLPLWEGDKIFLEALVKDERFFELTLNYNKDTLESYELKYKQ